MRNTLISAAFGGLLVLGGCIWHDPASAQPMRGPRSIDQELAHLTKELALTQAEQQQIRPLLLEHRQKIQTLFDKNPSVSRETLRPQIHAISDTTHHEIEALLTDHQKQLAKAMQARMHQHEGGPHP
jgi:hypothetical protein